MTDDMNMMQADPTGLLASIKASSDKPFLGDMAVLDGLVREMAGGVLERFEKVGAGDLSPAEASSADQEACHQLARTLIGQNDRYAPMPGWTTGGLAASIRNQMGEAVHSEDDVSVVAQACAVFVHDLYSQIGTITEDSTGESINESIRAFVWLLLGIQSNE